MVKLVQNLGLTDGPTRKITFFLTTEGQNTTFQWLKMGSEARGSTVGVREGQIMAQNCPILPLTAPYFDLLVSDLMHN